VHHDAGGVVEAQRVVDHERVGVALEQQDVPVEGRRAGRDAVDDGLLGGARRRRERVGLHGQDHALEVVGLGPVEGGGRVLVDPLTDSALSDLARERAGRALTTEECERYLHHGC
jgi:hypothetical protein